MKKPVVVVIRFIDFILIPFVGLSAMILKFVRKAGVQRMLFSKAIFNLSGVFPILDHYFEPLFNPRHLRYDLRKDRSLPGIDWNVEEQISLLRSFDYARELDSIPVDRAHRLDFFYDNDSFRSGDAEMLYSVIRHFKPQKILEIGSGNSTLMAIQAIRQNKKENLSYSCDHACIEPYEAGWLDQAGVRVLRELVENVPLGEFDQLQKNDLLFIDSSHIIRPQGDVLYEYLEILPRLSKGVIIHIHDIFTPKDYLNEWVIDEVKFWNEQYLLEAFLSFNKSFKVLCGLNYLKHHQYELLASRCPKLTPDREPGSIYLQRI